MHRVQSYVAGSWHRPGEALRTLRDAATAAPVAELGVLDLDPAEAVAHARTVGGAAIRDLTFHQRAAILRRVGKLLLADDAKRKLYDLSHCTGATAADSWLDIDGGAGVLMSYASKARRELPNSGVVIDGATEPLSADGSFSAVHILSARRGVEVQINAFNFPVWGMLEKFAPAFLAGVPSIVKPASPTAYLAEAAVRLIIDSGLLPEGALQLICASASDPTPSSSPSSSQPVRASAGDPTAQNRSKINTRAGQGEAPPEISDDQAAKIAATAEGGSVDGLIGALLDSLGGQDSISFTGSADTAAMLRSHPSVTSRSVRLNTEADSLNAAILAPAATPGTAEFDVFVDEVVNEMTVKAGQKCTAIRRVLVPDDRVDAAAEGLRDALARIVVGDPRHDTTTMGPLVGLDQRDQVTAAMHALRADAHIIAGEGDLSTVDTAAGAFMSPVLLQAEDRHSPAIHNIEAFGPVATLVAYRGLDEAVEIAALGGGSLVASLYGPDQSQNASLALGIASHHGRVLIADRTTTAASTGHGSPLPPLVHGGPGRAGGGQEMGGMRSVHSHMQRTAVQGAPDMLTAVTGELITGSSIAASKGHPFKLTFDDLDVGDSVTTESRVVTRADIDMFAERTGDRFYAHVDEDAAKRSPIFGGLVAHGYLVLSFAAGLFVWPDEGPVLANYGIDRLRFAKPTYPGDEIHVVLACKRKTQLDGRGYGEVAWDTSVVNQHGETVAAYDVLTMVANAPGVNGAPT